MKIPPDWLQACEKVGTTRSAHASWLLQFSIEAQTFDQLDSARQKSLQWQLQAFLDEGKWSDSSNLWVEEEFARWWYSEVCKIFGKLREKKSAYYKSRIAQIHTATAAINESTGTMKVDTQVTTPGLTKGDAIHRVFSTLDGILSRCARCGRLFIRTGRQRYCKTQCSNLVRLHRFRAKRTSVIDSPH